MESLTLYPMNTLHTALEKFCEAMPHITKLSLLCCLEHENNYNGVLRAISANMPHLKYLDISYCKVTPKNIEYLLPTEDNALGGCAELVYLDMRGIKNVDVDVFKKIILSLPKLRTLKHESLVNSLEDLTEEEMGVDTARYMNIEYSNGSPYGLRYEVLAKSPIFQRFNNNITTAVIYESIADEFERKSEFLADLLLLLPKLRCVELQRVLEAHVLPPLASIGDRLVNLELFGLTGYLTVQSILTYAIIIAFAFPHFIFH